MYFCVDACTKVQVRPAYQAAGVMGGTRCVGAGSWASAWAGSVSSICRAISPALETYSSLRTHHSPSVVLHFCPTQMQLSMLTYNLLTSQAEPTTALQNSTALINSTTPLRVTELSIVIIPKPYRFIYDLQLNQGYSWVTLSFGLQSFKHWLKSPTHATAMAKQSAVWVGTALSVLCNKKPFHASSYGLSNCTVNVTESEK